MVKTIVKKKEDSTEEVETAVPVLLPHLILEYIFKVVGVEIRGEILQKYWSHCKQHFAWAAPDDFDGSHIPLSIYGDSARYGQGYDQSKVTGCWMSLVLWRPKSTRMSQWLLWSLNADVSLGARSHNPLYLAIVQSLNHAFNGVSPEGRLLPHKFCVAEIKGDWEYMYQTFSMKRFWKTRHICWRCLAENHVDAQHCFLDFAENPSWVGTQISNNEFLAQVVGNRHVCSLVFICKVVNRI